MSDKGSEERIAMERKELDLLVGKGFHFDVTVRGRKRTFEVHEPTAWVLDCLSALYLELEMDEQMLSDANACMIESNRLVRKHAFRMARVIAVAVAGDTYSFFAPERWIRRLFHRAKVARLARLFYHSLSPSKMKELSVYLLATGNMADFINSIRLISGARTTIKIKKRIEKQG
jgi:hypothetical protein